MAAKLTEMARVNIKDLKPYEKNAKIHSKEQIEKIAESIKEFGFINPVLIDKDNHIIAGHGRTEAAKKAGMTEVPVVYIEGLTEAQRRAYIIADNRLSEMAEWSQEILEEELEALAAENFDITLTGFDFMFKETEEEKATREQTIKNKLQEKFLIPPFTVLDARQGYWQDRKKIWNEIIKDNGQARQGANNLRARDVLQRKVNGKSYTNYGENGGASLLDPVLAEVIFTWFTPKNTKKCFDCFAGDTAFGFVASYLGGEFKGTELRQEQADFNQQRVDEYNLPATYYCDDGRNIRKHIEDESQDLLFSCPPYFDMEVYSDMENDASNQKNYEDFIKIIDEAFTEAGKCLKNNRFAVITTQDIRDRKTGVYYNFPEDIKRIFLKNGFSLYNELVLVRIIGTGALIAEKGMESRKVRNVHEDVLVFYKGDTGEIENDFSNDFLTKRQNIDAHEKVLVFYKGDTKNINTNIKKDFGIVETEQVIETDVDGSYIDALLKEE